MVANIASDMAGKAVGKLWSSRFVARHKDILDSRYLNTLDLARHKADSRESYKQYFDIIREKIEEYGITADNIYNMDEKGFMIGVCQKTRRIFTKQTFEENKLARAGQDGNREWITVLAAICASGTALSPSLIYKAASGNIQADWLLDFDPNEHSCFFASTANGWTSDEHGLAWLEQVFDKETKNKARRSWRLLFTDGHGSHLNMKFIEKCEELRILLAIYPPHSTHRLQPLDVSCFSPLASYYSQGLNRFIMNSAGHTSIKKRDFFHLFWEAYEKTFNERVIASAWSKTGIWPLNPPIVLDALPTRPKTPPPISSGHEHDGSSSPIEFSTPTRARKSHRRVIQASATSDRRSSKYLKRLLDITTKSSAEITIMKLDVQHLKESLTREKRHRGSRKKKVLEQLRSDGQTGALFMSPSKVQKAKDLLLVREQEEHHQQAEKEARKQVVAQKKADKELKIVQRREARAVAAAARLVAAAEKKAASEAARFAKQAQKELAIATKTAIKVSKVKPKKKIVARKPALKPVTPALPETDLQAKSRTGRAIKKPARFRA